MRIPCDSILVEGTDIACDESGLTGEAESVEKEVCNEQNYDSNPNPFLLGKTLLISGQGLALICAVGSNTRSGMAEEKLNIEDQATPLQNKLETIANTVGLVGMYVAALTFIAMTLQYVIRTMIDPNQSFGVSSTLQNLTNFLIIGITIVVVAVPEGLPLAVTISLAYSVSKMKDKNNLVRRLDASETMGGANEICTDKTGTLTQNKMFVMEYYALDTTYKGASSVKTSSLKELLIEGILYNCSARIEIENGAQVAKGNCTEQGLIRFLLEAEIDPTKILNSKTDSTLQLIPFNSKIKMACSVIRHPDDKDKVRIFVKGAPEIVIPFCNSTFNQSGEVV